MVDGPSTGPNKVAVQTHPPPNLKPVEIQENYRIAFSALPRLAAQFVEKKKSRNHRDRGRASAMSALFNFNSFLIVVLLVICTCTYIKMQFPAILNDRTGFRGFFWKAARIGERLSPWVAFGCFAMGVSTIFF